MKVAIIGLGAISPLHIEAVKSLGGKIVAICDVDKTKVARANEEYSLGANEYTNYVEMLDNESIDVVHICTPHYLHAHGGRGSRKRHKRTDRETLGY